MIENENVLTLYWNDIGLTFLEEILDYRGNILDVKLELKEAKEKIRELEAKLLMVDYKKDNNVEDSDKCIVCCENDRDAVYTTCMHLSTCYDCCSEIGDRCPVCREPSEYKRLYIPREFSYEISYENYGIDTRVERRINFDRTSTGELECNKTLTGALECN